MRAGVIGPIWRQYRFELVSVLAATALMVAFALFTAVRMDDIRPDPAEIAACTEADDGLSDPRCADVSEWLSLRETEAFRLFGAMPFVAGALLGSVLVSREIEHRTAQFGWSLRGSRRRWLLERALPVGLLLLAALAVLGAATDALEAARYPGVPPGASLDEYGQRGLPLVMRGLACFAGAVVLGASIGRQLPSLIMGATLALAMGYALSLGFPLGTRWQWVPEEDARSSIAEIAWRQARNGFQDATGLVVSYREASRSVPDGLASGAADDWLYENYAAVAEVLTGEQATEIVVREATALGVFAMLMVAGAMLVVERRRPY